MDDNLFPKLSHPLKTRADLKRELLSTIPQGEELNFLQLAQRTLDESRESLQALRTERASLTRQISIRKRKIQDWKSKIPRAAQPSHDAAQTELNRLGDVPCYAVATVEKRSSRAQTLVFQHSFRLGLTGLAGFDKVWVLFKSTSSQSCQQGGAVADGLSLVLVDLIRVDVAKGVVEVDGLGEECIGVDIIDIKPYLAYCEAFPDDSRDGQAGNDEGSGLDTD